MKIRMRGIQLVVVTLFALSVLVHCGAESGDPEQGDDESPPSESAAALSCVGQWDPTWAQTTYANNWWVEYVITGGTVASAYLEVVGRANVPLSYRYGKWVGPTSFRIATGTPVVVHAQSSSGQKAQTVVFGYLSVRNPVTACTGADAGADAGGDAGADSGRDAAADAGGDAGRDAAADAGGEAGADAGACWSPSWQQTSYANNWWAEYMITGGTVTSASLEVVGVRTVALSLSYGKWVGSTGARIDTGTSVVVHAGNAAGQSAQTRPFGYLVVLRPETAPCCVPSCTGRNCGDDGCGGSCGTCGANSTCGATGSCACSGSRFRDCDGLAANGCEADTLNDRNNCDVCGHKCASDGTQYCGAAGGAIGCLTCPSGTGDCDATGVNRCETQLLANHENCGACGKVCLTSQVCQSGSCVAACTAPNTACSGGCVNLQTDPAHCGGCNRACGAGQICRQATCLSCGLNLMDCDGLAANGCEANRLDRNSCGVCGNSCAANAYCQLGFPPFSQNHCAVCPAGRADCDGLGSGLDTAACEVDITSDEANCGACGNACPAGRTCSAGTCL